MQLEYWVVVPDIDVIRVYRRSDTLSVKVEHAHRHRRHTSFATMTSNFGRLDRKLDRLLEPLPEEHQDT